MSNGCYVAKKQYFSLTTDTGYSINSGQGQITAGHFYVSLKPYSSTTSWTDVNSVNAVTTKRYKAGTYSVMISGGTGARACYGYVSIIKYGAQYTCFSSSVNGGNTQNCSTDGVEICGSEGNCCIEKSTFSFEKGVDYTIKVYNVQKTIYAN